MNGSTGLLLAGGGCICLLLVLGALIAYYVYSTKKKNGAAKGAGTSKAGAAAGKTGAAAGKTGAAAGKKPSKKTSNGASKSKQIKAAALNASQSIIWNRLTGADIAGKDVTKGEIMTAEECQAKAFAAKKTMLVFRPSGDGKGACWVKEPVGEPFNSEGSEVHSSQPFKIAPGRVSSPMWGPKTSNGMVGHCPNGSSVSGVNPDGTVSCYSDSIFVPDFNIMFVFSRIILTKIFFFFPSTTQPEPNQHAAKSASK
jgi:hypothetical protein